MLFRSLQDLDWLVAALNELGDTHIEQFEVLHGLWHIRTVASDSFTIPVGHTVLFRAVGVDVCPLFSFELDQLHAELGLGRAPDSMPVEDSRTDMNARVMEAVLWHQVRPLR